MKSSLSGQGVVIVTGATAGIGRAVAFRFARAGFRIGLIARDGASLEAVRQELEEFGVRTASAAADVADADAVFAAAEKLEAELGPIDIWINDAMETMFATFADMTAEEFRRITEVTYLGFVHGTMAALKSMQRRRRGRIIQMGSALAYRGIPLQSAYCGAKHAIRGFTDSVRTELIHARSAIKLTIVDLPAVNTPQFDWARVRTGHSPRPMGRPVEPELVAEAVFRASKGCWREYWLGVPTWQTILGNTILPSLLDHYLARAAFKGQQTDTPLAPGRQDNLDRPVSALHRTRGSFSDEALEDAPLVPGEVGRLGAVVAGATIFFALGALYGRLRRNRRQSRSIKARHVPPGL